MKISIRNKQINIPADDPFKNDLFDRQGPVTDLTNLVDNLIAPAVIVVDSAWGTGKTTFLNLWKQCLLNDNRLMVHFNAWENDYSANALASILYELTSLLRDCDPRFGIKDMVSETAINVFTEVLNTSLKAGSGGILSVDSFNSESDIFTAYKNHKQQLTKFRKNIGELTQKYRSEKGCPLVIVIDELDRCRPTFAIELLEVAKHLFSVGDIVFVLAMNQRELCQSITSIYGERFDSVGYLERFVDITFRLPPADRRKFLLSQLSEKLEYRYDTDIGYRHAIDMLFTIYALPNFNLRTASHYIRRLDYVLASIGYGKNWMFLQSLVVALIARSVDPENYLQFNNGNLSDDEFVNSIFQREGLLKIRETTEGAWIEAIIIATQQEKARIRMNNDAADVSRVSNLYLKYETIMADSNFTEDEKHHAAEVMDNLRKDTVQNSMNPSPVFGKFYLRAVELVEMMVPRS